MRSAAIVACLGLVLLGACDKPQPAAEIRPVRTVTASTGSDGEPVSLTGHIHARTEESLAFRIDGRMIAGHVGVGQVVRPNDLIAELDPLPQRDALHEAQARLAAAEATVHEAGNNMERQRSRLGNIELCIGGVERSLGGVVLHLGRPAFTGQERKIEERSPPSKGYEAHLDRLTAWSRA
jgi:hypothetical protein